MAVKDLHVDISGYCFEPICTDHSSVRSSPTTAEGLWKRSGEALAASLPWNVTKTAAMRLSARTTVAWYSMAPTGREREKHRQTRTNRLQLQ